MANNLTNKELLHRAKNEPLFLNDFIKSEQAFKFIKYVIKTYTKSPEKFMQFNRIEYEELMHLGEIGLFKGIMDASLDKDEKEIQRYLYLRIQGELREVARSNSSNSISVSQRIRGMYPSYLKFQNEFFTDNHRDPTIEETMKEFGIGKEDAYDLVYGMQAVISDEVETSSGIVSILDIMQARYFAKGSLEQKVITKMALEEKLARLNKKERTVINMKYFLGYNNSEIAKHIGCANSMVAKYLKTSFAKLAQV